MTSFRERVAELIASGNAEAALALVDQLAGERDQLAEKVEKDEIHLFDADDRSPEGSIDLSGIAGDVTDSALVGGYAVLAVHTGSGGELVIVDSTGTVEDTQALGSAVATYVHIDGDAIRAFWAGVDTWPVPKYAIGLFELED